MEEKSMRKVLIFIGEEVNDIYPHTEDRKYHLSQNEGILLTNFLQAILKNRRVAELNSNTNARFPIALGYNGGKDVY